MTIKTAADSATPAHFDEPNAAGEYPYDATETFSEAELASAATWRLLVGPDAATRRRLGRVDHCPHQPACPTVRVCVEEIAWYLRHRRALDGGMDHQ